MDEELIRFASFLENERQMAKNTLVSYERDLRQMISWMAGRGVTESGKVTETLLASYVLWLERQGKATTTISRVVASMKSFFAYEQKQGIIGTNPAEGIKAPKVEKKAPTIMTAEEVEAFLAQTRGKTLKKIRDRAMMELLCATGLRVSELIDLKVQDLNFQIGYVICRDEDRERAIPFGREAQDALLTYLSEAREKLLKSGSTDLLFVNKNVPDMKIAVELGADRDAIVPPSVRHAVSGATVIAQLASFPMTVSSRDEAEASVKYQSERTLSGVICASPNKGESTTDQVFSGLCLVAENGVILANEEKEKRQNRRKKRNTEKKKAKLSVSSCGRRKIFIFRNEVVVIFLQKKFC